MKHRLLHYIRIWCLTLCFVITLLSIRKAHSSEYKLGSLNTFGSLGNEHVSDMVTLSNGTLLLTGTILSNDTLFFEENKAQVNGGNDLFLAIANPEGKITDFRIYGGKGNDFGSKLIQISDSLILLSGGFQNSINLGSTILQCSDNGLFVAKLNLNGEVLAATSFEVESGEITSLASDSNALYLAGYASSYLISEGFENRDLQLNAVVAAKLNHSLETDWIKVFDGPGHDRASVLSQDATGNIRIGAVVSPGFQLEDVVCSSDTLPDKFQTALLMEIDSKGELINVQRITDGYRLKIEALLCDGQAAWFSCKLMGDYQVGDSIYKGSGGYDVFLQKRLGDSLLFHKPYVGENSDHIMAIRQIDGMIYVTGATYGTLHIGNDSIAPDSLPGTTFIAQYLPNGTLMYASPITGVGSDYPVSMVTGKNGHMYAAGNFNKNISFKSEAIPSKGKDDLFIAKIVNCGALNVKLNGDSILCQGATNQLTVSGEYDYYFWNNETYGGPTLEVTKEGLYSILVRDTLGCEMEDEIYVREVALPQPVLPEPFGLFAGDTAMLNPGKFEQYQWQDFSSDSIYNLAGNDIMDSTLIKVTVENPWGCAASDSVWISAGTYQMEELNDISGYPTTTDGLIFLKNTGTNQYRLHIRVLTSDKIGVVYDNWDVVQPGQTVQIDLTGQSSGSYHVNIFHGNAYWGQSFIKK